VYIGGFEATWTWTDAELTQERPNTPGQTADGFTFTIANDPRGPGALGTEATGPAEAAWVMLASPTVLRLQWKSTIALTTLPLE